MKPLLDEKEKQGLWKSHRSDTRLESQPAVATEYSTNTKHNTNFITTEVIANIWTYLPCIIREANGIKNTNYFNHEDGYGLHKAWLYLFPSKNHFITSAPCCVVTKVVLNVTSPLILNNGSLKYFCHLFTLMIFFLYPFLLYPYTGVEVFFSFF
jgi:hypothetical protein